MTPAEFIESFDLLIFDLDGTLVDSYEQIESAMNIARASLGYPKSPTGQIFERLGLPVYKLFSDLELNSVRQEDLIKEFRKKLYEEIKIENKCFPYVVPLLQQVRKMGMKTAIATSKSTGMAKTVVENSPLFGTIDFIQGTDGFLPKPNPEVISRCLREFPGLRAVMIGDRQEDIMAATSAGIPSVGVAQSAHSELNLELVGANLTFKNISNLYKWFIS
jgi:phosphoglycolate phosphatase